VLPSGVEPVQRPAYWVISVNVGIFQLWVIFFLLNKYILSLSCSNAFRSALSLMSVVVPRFNILF
jgi:hypothetical protein